MTEKAPEHVDRWEVTHNANGLGFSDGIRKSKHGTFVSLDDYQALSAERDALAAEVERLRGHLDDAASAVEWGARRMETQSYKVLMEKWASEYRSALEEGKDG